MQKQFSRIYPVFFIAVFFGVLLFQLNVPNLSLDTLSENFLWRRDLIENFNNFRFMTGDRVFNIAIVGKQGWLYFTGSASIEDYQKNRKIKTQDLQSAMKGLVAFNKYVNKNGGKLIVVIAPDKHTVYPQYMPEEIPVLGQMSRADMLMDFIKKNKINIEMIDLRPVLLKHSSSEQLYYKTDTHWNCLGAYYGYQEVMSRLSPSYPELSAHSLEDFGIETTIQTTRDIPKKMGFQILENRLWINPGFKQDHLGITYNATDENIKFTENTTHKDLPTALIFHDSFYISCFNQLFEPHFSRTTAISSRAINNKKYNRLIEKEQPNIVMIEFVERSIDTTLIELKAFKNPQ